MATLEPQPTGGGTSPGSPAPAASPPPDGRESKTPTAGDFVAAAVGGLFARWRFLAVLPFFALGGLLLSGATHALASFLRYEALLRSLSGRAEARLVEHYWRLEPGRPLSPGMESFVSRGRARLWTVYEMSPAGGEPVRFALAGDPRGNDLWEWQWSDGGGLDRHLALPWSDPDTGLPRLELRLPRTLAAELRSRPAASWPLQTYDDELAATEKPGSELDAFWIELDRPFEALARLWLRPPGRWTIAVGYDPAAPRRVLPLTYLEENQTGRRVTTAFVLGISGIVGGAFFLVGLVGVTAGLPRLLRIALVLAAFVAIPWWGQALGRVVGWWDHDAQRFVEEFRFFEAASDLGIVLPQEPPAPADEETLVWDFSTSAFRDELAPFHFTRPERRPADADAAWRAVCEPLALQMQELGDAGLARLFDRLILDQRRDLRGAGLAFTEGARRLSVDAARSDNVQAWARAFLSWMLWGRNDPESAELAFRQKVAYIEALRDHPDEGLRQKAGESLARIARFNSN